MQRSAFLGFLAQEASFGGCMAEVGGLTGPGVCGVKEEDEGQRVPAQPGRRRDHARQRDRDHDQRHQHLEPRPAARAPQHPHMCMQRRTAAPQKCDYTGLCTPQDSNMCVPALQCLVEMQTAAALQPSSRRPLATHVLVSSMRILLFRTLARSCKCTSQERT